MDHKPRKFQKEQFWQNDLQLTVDRLNSLQVGMFLSSTDFYRKLWVKTRPPPAEARMVLALLFLAGHIAWMPSTRRKTRLHGNRG